MEKLYSVQEIADAVGLTDKRIRQIARDVIAAGHGQKVGKVLVFKESAITHIKGRKDNRKKSK